MLVLSANAELGDWLLNLGDDWLLKLDAYAVSRIFLLRSV